MNITGTYVNVGIEPRTSQASGAFSIKQVSGNFYYHEAGRGTPVEGFDFNASKSWTGNTSSVSPYTTAIGSGTPLTVNPEHIIVKAWKRTS